MDQLFKLNLKFERTEAAVRQRKEFLRKRKIGICDIVASARRAKIDASDLGMQEVQLRDMLGYLHKFPKVNTLIFTGGNSKNGPEFFFRRLLKEQGLTLEVISNEVPRIHQFLMPAANGSRVSETSIDRKITTVSLTAPSGAANRAVGSLDEYKALKNANPEFNTFDFRVRQYRPFF